MAVQQVREDWIYQEANTLILQKNQTTAQGVFQPIHWVALGRMQAEIRLTPYEGQIADIGCGHGILTVNLAWKRSRTTIIGIDPDEGRLAVGSQLAREHRLANVSFKPGSLENPGIPEASCTGVLCTEVLEHLPQAKERLQENVARLLKLLVPGGRLILSFLDPEGGQRPSGLCWDDFRFLPKRVMDRNCPRWWYLFYVDKT